MTGSSASYPLSSWPIDRIWITAKLHTGICTPTIFQILRIGVSNCLWLCVKNMYVVILMHSYKLFRCYVTVCSYYFPKVLIVLYLLVKHCTFNISCPWYQCVSQAKTHMCYSAHCNTHFNCWKQLGKCMLNLNCSTTWLKHWIVPVC